MKKQIHDEIAGLVVLGIERVVGKVLDQPDHNKLIDQAIENLKSEISAQA